MPFAPYFLKLGSFELRHLVFILLQLTYSGDCR